MMGLRITLPAQPMRPEQVARLNSLQLAYVGDTVYDLYIRTHLVATSEQSVCRLHREAVERVNATAQAQALRRVEPMFTEEEREVARRGRNAHGRAPRHADPADYAQATALEALLGYLYLTGREERLKEIMDRIMEGGDAPCLNALYM